MKKHYSLTLLLLTFSFLSFGQELLVNGNFESWDDSTTPTGWTKVEDSEQESTEIHGGSYALKHTGGTSDIGQTITGIEAGKSYTITVWYKVEADGADGTDTRIWSYWRDADGSNISDEATDSSLRPSSYFDNNENVWSEHTTTVVAPEGATQFYFELRTYGSAVVFYDDLSFFAEDNATASIVDNSIEGFSTYPNPITNNTFVISTTSLDLKEVTIFNVLGEQVLSKKYSDMINTIDVSDLSTGLYILHVKQEDKQVTKKLIIK